MTRAWLHRLLCNGNKENHGMPLHLAAFFPRRSWGNLPIAMEQAREKARGTKNNKSHSQNGVSRGRLVASPSKCVLAQCHDWLVQLAGVGSGLDTGSTPRTQ